MSFSEKSYLYCTAIIQSTKKVPYEQLVSKLNQLKEDTKSELGCISFEIVPLNRDKERFALWEVWKDTNAFYTHHKKEYTKRFFNEKLDTIELFESSKEVTI
ncbi:antibiotic biosynthesis monooxygenase [Erwinia sp. CPCC 100877]|nr:antibiotic biosynthesis monooxygenase [Erwinia sp. CPCC 100877]